MRPLPKRVRRPRGALFAWGFWYALVYGCGGQASKGSQDASETTSTATSAGGGGRAPLANDASSASSGAGDTGGSGAGGESLASSEASSAIGSGASSAGGSVGDSTAGAGATGGAGGQGGAGVEPEVVDFCERWGEAACGELVLEYCAADEASCRSAQSEFCESLFVGASFDPDGAASCLLAVTLAYEDGDLYASELDTVRSLENECDAVAVRADEEDPPCDDCNGDLAPAAPCTDTRQCDTDSYCGFEGRCATRGSIGDTCSEDRLCEAALHCLLVGDAEGACVAVVRLGRQEPMCDEFR